MGEGLERKRQERERQLANKAMEQAVVQPLLGSPSGTPVERRIALLSETVTVVAGQTLIARYGRNGVEFFRGVELVGFLDAEVVRQVCTEPQSAIFRVMSVSQGMVDLRVEPAKTQWLKKDPTGEDS